MSVRITKFVPTLRSDLPHAQQVRFTQPWVDAIATNLSGTPFAESFAKADHRALDIPTLELIATARDALKLGGEWENYEFRLAKLGSGKVETEEDRDLLREMGRHPDVVQFAPARLGIDSLQAFVDSVREDDSLGDSTRRLEAQRPQLKA